MPKKCTEFDEYSSEGFLGILLKSRQVTHTHTYTNTHSNDAITPLQQVARGDNYEYRTSADLEVFNRSGSRFTSSALPPDPRMSIPIIGKYRKCLTTWYIL